VAHRQALTFIAWGERERCGTLAALLH